MKPSRKVGAFFIYKSHKKNISTAVLDNAYFKIKKLSENNKDDDWFIKQTYIINDKILQWNFN